MKVFTILNLVYLREILDFKSSSEKDFFPLIFPESIVFLRTKIGTWHHEDHNPQRDQGRLDGWADTSSMRLHTGVLPLT